jgi:hypothetical protein
MGSAPKRGLLALACLAAALLLIAPGAAAKPGRELTKPQIVISEGTTKSKARADLWAMPPDGGRTRPLLNLRGKAIVGSAAVTQSGRQVFAVARSGASGQLEVFLAPLWRGRAKLLSSIPDNPATIEDDPIGRPAISRTGRIVWNRGSDGLWTMNADGTGVASLHAGCHPCPDGIDRFPGEPAISDDGRLVAFIEGSAYPGNPTGNYAIRVINIDGTGVRTVRDFPPPEISCCRLAISGDGRRVASGLVNTDTRQTVAMTVMSTDGSGFSRHPMEFFDQVVFNPGGGLVAFSGASPSAPEGGVYVLNPATGRVRRVLRGDRRMPTALDWAGLAPESKRTRKR